MANTGADPGGWTVFKRLPGWEEFTVSIKVDGLLTVTGLRIEPIKASTALPSLSALDLRALAREATGRGVSRDMKVIARRKVAKHDKRAVTTVEQVAQAHRLAVTSGAPDPRAVVVEQLAISASTADRYIRRAREAGLIPPASKTTSTTDREAQR